MINLTLKGEPKSTNHIYKMTCRGRFASMYMSKEGKALKEDYQWQIKSQYKGKLLTGVLSIALELHFKTLRKADWDNFNKIVMDACTSIVWVDDSQIRKATVSKHYDKNNPRIEIQINEI